MKTAAEPFRFHARFVMSLATGRSARDLSELRAGIAELPESVIYRHTYHFLAEHEALVPEPTNDFSLWVSEALGEEALAERLAAVDTLAFSSVEALRVELLRVIDASPANSAGRSAPSGEEFYFQSTKRFSVSTGVEARTLEEFAEGLRKVGPSSIYLHLFEAKLRPPLGVNDFSLWLERELGETGLAREVADIGLYHATLSGVRDKIGALVRSHMETANAAS